MKKKSSILPEPMAPTTLTELEQLINERINKIALKIENPVENWDASNWESVARIYIAYWIIGSNLLSMVDDLHANTLKAMETEKLRRQEVGASRLNPRRNTIDRIAFHAAFKANQQDYAEVQDAVDDLGINEQFKNYSNETLRKWARQVWTKPIKKGRRKKSN